jgi:hypothetical protein
MPIKRKRNAGLSHRRKYKYASAQIIDLGQVNEVPRSSVGDEETGEVEAEPPVTQQLTNAATNDNENALSLFLSARDVELRFRMAVFLCFY